jgi:phage terminase small subunit
MARTLTPRRKGFVKDYLKTGNATLAAKENFNTSNDNSAAAIGSELLRIPKIKEYIESKASRAAEIVYEIADNEDNEPPVRLNASKDILDRAGFKPVEKSQSVNINLDGTPTERTRELGDRLLGLLRRGN